MYRDDRFRHDASEEDPYEKGFADCLYQDDYADDYDEPQEEKKLPPAAQVRYRPDGRYQKPKHTGRRVFTVLLVLVLAAALLGGAVLWLYPKQPTGTSLGEHRNDRSTILLAGTDESGDHTDTLMLLSVDRSAKRISLMSIPRDTKVNSRYEPHKINGAYAANGRGEEGMDALMDYVGQCIGFRPDGYILVDLNVFVELVDLFGGVRFNVPQDMYYDDPSQDLHIDLKAGEQRLNGEQAMGLVRFRSGYAMADLQRVSVQRDFMMEAISQWKSPKNALHYYSALSLLEKNSLTDLDKAALLWLAESVVLCGTSDMQMMTIPYYLGDFYVYIDADQDYLELINTYFNPYERAVGFEDLNVAY